ncbi:membrane protein insertase YidC [Flavobacteriaceae bacterium Ap0902]|nr:membrane protein insertase YidC [Flavobacteriaceae bacterium Ap0902]
MQEKKFDVNQLIGFGLLLALFIGYFFLTQPSEEERLALEAEQEQLAAEEQSEVVEPREEVATVATTDSISANIGNQTFTLENENLLIELTNIGAQLSKVELKKFQAYDDVAENHEKPLYIIHDGNAKFGLKFTDNQGVTLDLSKRKFVGEQKGDQVIFTTQVDQGQVQYIYTINDAHELQFDVVSTGITQVTDANIDFSLNAISQEKGKAWEKRTTDIHYSLNNYSDEDYTSSDFTADSDETLDWVAFKQQFFTTILEKDGGLKGVTMDVFEKDEDHDDPKFSKYFSFNAPVETTASLNQSYTWHFLPLEFNLLKSYDKDFQHIIPFGWGIFGWINEWVILPTFRFMATWGLQYGWVIALLTIVIKLVTSPIMYKQYRQSAMMRVLKPDMDELNKKYPDKDDAMKKQQEVMKLYRTAGVNPLAGCLPALLQIPIFYALFNFFPNIIDLRGKSFLWAEDLTAYDSIMDLGFSIPFYGDHISLFALLYVITMVIYFRTSGNMMNAPTQEGMPNMKVIMYLMPIMFIFFLNSYASGLSLYYFVSNAINIGLVFVIKNWLIDDDKIHAKIQANKAKPKKNKKKNRWAAKLENAMKTAQQQQELQKKKKK